MCPPPARQAIWRTRCRTQRALASRRSMSPSPGVVSRFSTRWTRPGPSSCPGAHSLPDRVGLFGFTVLSRSYPGSRAARRSIVPRRDHPRLGLAVSSAGVAPGRSRGLISELAESIAKHLLTQFLHRRRQVAAPAPDRGERGGCGLVVRQHRRMIVRPLDHSDHARWRGLQVQIFQRPPEGIDGSRTRSS